MNTQLSFLDTEPINREYFEKRGFTCKQYMNGVQLNVTDKSGIIQTFYPTTGTIVLHASNERNDRRLKSIKNSDVGTFIRLLENPSDIQAFFER